MESNSSFSKTNRDRQVSGSGPRDRLIFLLRLFLPVIIFLVGILIITSKQLLVDKPSWQKNSVGVLFIVYSIFRLYQAFTKFFQKEKDE